MKDAVTAYKVVGRCSKTKRQKKKRVYVSYEDFKKYSPDVIKRYSRCYGIAESYRFIGGEWVITKTVNDDGK